MPLQPTLQLRPQAATTGHENILAWCLRVGLPVDTNNLARLNDDENVGEAVRYVLLGLRHWGVTPTLNFQRGGALCETPLAVGFVVTHKASKPYPACQASLYRVWVCCALAAEYRQHRNMNIFSCSQHGRVL